MASLSWLLWNQIMLFGGAIKRRHLWEDMQERYVSVERSVSCREERGLLLERKVLFRLEGGRAFGLVVLGGLQGGR